MPAGAHEIGGVSLETVPHWMRGGSALLRRQRVRRALALSVHDAFALWIALDAQVRYSPLLIATAIAIIEALREPMPIQYVFKMMKCTYSIIL